MHPAKEGFSALPFFDEFDLSTVDILLISQYVIYSSPLYLQSPSWSIAIPACHMVPSVFGSLILDKSVFSGSLVLIDAELISSHVYEKHNTNYTSYLSCAPNVSLYLFIALAFLARCP